MMTIEQTQPQAAALDGPIVALIPAYNEDRFIASVVLKARHFVDEVIVVDDGSSDETAALAEEVGAHVIRQPHNQGKAAAINVGLEFARRIDARALVMLDGALMGRRILLSDRALWACPAIFPAGESSGSGRSRRRPTSHPA
jgi:glycosyltransferase involved in cell wall biosynthesis